ncbi:MAG: LysM peptidoglycan-binding domain-containing protein [Reyranella sp.]|uniref:LysM peptidoglycan-binding domain-containing protein n=1 Tax=Reyranella sp. TaxID=1929291 RepID=UPI001AD24E2C|nr:LysM peptidoglycan-binding domain-containing protein [Reyranella sp.]MBN9088986.1 LysM peptidoglycan-binding domain-containing protein [Reyranella sp.]
MSRTVLALVAVGAVIIAAALGYAWRVKMADQAAIQAVQPGAPAAAAATAPSPPSAVAPAASTAPAPQASVMVPSFDVARIDRDGRAVIAGRAAPGAKIVLLDGGKEIARGEADARGEWVILAQDTPLAPGPHELRAVQHIEGRAPVTSEQVVVAVVPQPPGTDKTAQPEETLVMISPSSGAATLVQPPSPAGVPKVGDLQVSTLDYDDRGQATITGQATPGATVRAYLDDKPVAEGKAGSDGRWRLAPSDPLHAGEHRLRVDRLAQDGMPVARLEMKFQRQEALPAENTRRLHIVRGDNLWNIARAHYGEGFRYTTIFEANKDLIRDPNLIYPGQIFTLPKVN